MIEIIPAIDIMEGKCVRLAQGDFSARKTYNESPLAVAKQFEDAGIKRLHLVDLDGARNGKTTNLPILNVIAKQTSLTIDYSGGIKTDEDIKSVFNSGAAYACIGSIAATNKELLLKWIDKYSIEKFILGADVRGEQIVINGWEKNTELNILDFLKNYVHSGINQIICTDVNKDGMLQGVSLELYKKIIGAFPKINLIASGGVSEIADITKLEGIGCAGVIIGKAFYEGRILLKDLEKLTLQWR